MRQMKVRHDNMLHLAHFLHTKTEPRLYYKPWELSPEDEDRIEDQIAAAREVMQRERDEYEEREDEDSRRERRATPDETTYRGTGDETGQAHAGAAETAEHGQDQEMQDEPSRDEPSRDEPSRDEPSTDNPNTDEPAADEPTKDADEEEEDGAAEEPAKPAGMSNLASANVCQHRRKLSGHGSKLTALNARS